MSDASPRIGLVPPMASTDGPEACRLASAYYLKPYGWQEDVLSSWLGRTPEGRWSARRCGLLVPRQNGKNAVIDMRELYGAVALGERVLHTAHQQKTSRNGFNKLLDVVSTGDLAQLVSGYRLAIGREAIYFTTGGSIEYMSRSRGGARGFTVDLVVCDEAQELTDEQLEALMPAMSAAPMGNPQLILTGTPPGPNCPGEVFGRMREDAQADAEGLSWHEWSVEDLKDADSPETWAACNPSLGRMLSLEAVRNEHDQMSPDGFARERLGWWPEKSNRAAIDPETWLAAVDRKPDRDGRVAYGVRFSNQCQAVSLAACVVPDDAGRCPHVEVIRVEDVAKGTEWLVSWLSERARRCAAIAVDGFQGAPMLAERLQSGGVPKSRIHVTGSRDVMTAASLFADALNRREVTHYAQPGLDEAVARAKRRPIGSNGGWGFGSIDGADVSPLEAVALAHWAALTARKRRKQSIAVL